ncbi:hypothetical protein IF650_12125 [Cellulosimicrobium terreum]|nr:hypothetical protein [Cellulosimicrobium terreum]
MKKNQIAMAYLLDIASVYTGTPGGLRPRARAFGGNLITSPAPDSAPRTSPV